MTMENEINEASETASGMQYINRTTVSRGDW